MWSATLQSEENAEMKHAYHPPQVYSLVEEISVKISKMVL